MDIDTNAAPADHCTLTHRVFTSFGEPLFRKAETDGTPVMVVKLGEKEAAIPLRSHAAGVRHRRRRRTMGRCSA